jgi:hypothetical protein
METMGLPSITVTMRINEDSLAIGTSQLDTLEGLIVKYGAHAFVGEPQTEPPRHTASSQVPRSAVCPRLAASADAEGEMRAQLTEPPHPESIIMADKSRLSRVKYCRHHNMVRSARTYWWKVVPADFIAELLHANFPVDLVEQPCPRCRKPGGH